MYSYIFLGTIFNLHFNLTTEHLLSNNSASLNALRLQTLRVVAASLARMVAVVKRTTAAIDANVLMDT